MIRQAFQHFRGIGAERLRRLQEAGIRDWDELAAFTDNLSLGDTGRARLRAEIEQCDRAIAERNMHYLVESFSGRVNLNCEFNKLSQDADVDCLFDC